jgi:bifunctional UDP-N-acetylglucosamine pyrophosphorylase/glucosamine-1-phosphate N-acetyltransferase
MSEHILRACREANVERLVVVVGHEAEKVQEGLKADDVEFALQAVPRGTGDAVRSAESALKDWQGTILILAGDVPLLPAQPLKDLIAHHQATDAAATLLTMEVPNASQYGYGRIVRDENGYFKKIVEQKDATTEELLLTECNPSIYAFQGAALWRSLEGIQPANAQGEYYFTDALQILNQAGDKIEILTGVNPEDVTGVNSRVELAEVSAILRQRILHKLMVSGVTIIDPNNTYIEAGVQIGQDTTIHPNTYLYGNTVIGEDCEIGPMTRIENSTLGDRVKVIASQIVESVLEEEVKVGPFANLRPKTYLEARVKIGDFVETKNARFGVKAQASHLSYIGDATVGAGTNLGAGTITCNYDGFDKHHTHIGENCFIGTHSTLVAPLHIGDEAMTAAGSVITEEVPAGALALARSRQTAKEDWAKERRAKKIAEKEAKKQSEAKG